jgi:hypothetical protein
MSAEEFTGLGFAPGVVRGVRSFNVDKFGRLTGIVYPQVWKPGENNASCRADDGPMNYGYTMTSAGQIFVRSQLSTPASPPSPSSQSIWARHLGLGHGGFDLPAVEEPKPKPRAKHSLDTCKCGFYGYFDGSDDYHDKGKISAVVEAYGEVIIGTRGFRAMKAKIVAVRVRADKDGIAGHMARKISNNYKGVAIFDNFEQMVAEFPPDVSLEPSPETDPEFWTRGI